VRKVIEGSVDPIYVMGVTAEYTFSNGRSDKHVGALLNELSMGISSSLPIIFVSLEGEHSYLWDKFRQISGSLIFRPS
jgi:hypothetical protein